MELGLSGREVVAQEYRGDAKVTLGEERTESAITSRSDQGAGGDHERRYVVSAGAAPPAAVARAAREPSAGK